MTKMKYIIKHKYGFTPKPNGHNAHYPFFGIDHGAGVACTRWPHFLSDTISKAFKKCSFKVEMQSPIRLVYSDKRFQADVDNTRWFFILHNDEINEVYEFLKEDDELWDKLLYAIGEKLELSKYQFVTFDWFFDAHGESTLICLPTLWRFVIEKWTV
jgi:hypothetical protein